MGKRREFGSAREPEQVQFLANKVLATFTAQQTRGWADSEPWRNGRREPKRVSTLFCPSPVRVQGDTLPALPAGGTAEWGAPRGGEGRGCWHRLLGSCTGLATLLRLCPDYFQKFEGVECEIKVFAKICRDLVNCRGESLCSRLPPGRWLHTTAFRDWAVPGGIIALCTVATE